MSRRDRLRVAVDLSPLPPSKAGVGRYAFGLLSALSPYVEANELDLICLAKTDDVSEVQSLVPAGEVVDVGSFRFGRPERLVWEQTVLPAMLRRIKARLFHGIHYSIPVASGVPSTVVFHDPTFWTHPELHSPSKVAYFRTMGRIASARSRLIFTVSNWSKESLVSILGLNPSKIRVVYHGVDEHLFEPASPGELDGLRKELGAEDAWLIAFVGTIEPRKNLPRLAMAVDMVRNRIDDRKVLLAVAGQTGWKTSESRAWLERGKEGGWIVELGYIDDSKKRLLLQAADLFAYVSLAEGFGIPALEALACRTPVVTSNRTATAEVASSAAMLVDPYDVHSIAGAIESLLRDRDLSESLVSAGETRAAEFTWTETARRTIEGWLDAVRD